MTKYPLYVAQSTKLQTLYIIQYLLNVNNILRSPENGTKENKMGNT